MTTAADGAQNDQGRQARAKKWIIILSIVLIILAFYSLSVGATELNMRVMLAWAMGQYEPTLRDQAILFNIRMPRLFLGMIIGASLAVSGAMMQGLFRNPLADPGIVGVSTGASFGAVMMIVLGNGLFAGISARLGGYDIAISACLGAWVFTWVLYKIASRGGRTSVIVMLLAGIALSAMIGAIMGFVIYYADDDELRELTFWGMGSLAGANWEKLAVSTPFMLSALVATPFIARALNGLAMGEAVAVHIGINVQFLKRISILTVALATGAAVAVSGGIGFVGLVAPHIVRLTLGPDHRTLIPAAGIIGAMLILVADAISRVVIAPAELPIGIIMSVIGGPTFLWMLMRKGGMRI